MQLYALSTTSFGRYVFDYLIQKKANTGRGNAGGKSFISSPTCKLVKRRSKITKSFNLCNRTYMGSQLDTVH